MNQTQLLPETERGALTTRQRSGRPLSPDTELNLPGWRQLPATRRQRLVALLGELVQRNRAPEENSDDRG